MDDAVKLPNPNPKINYNNVVVIIIIIITKKLIISNKCYQEIISNKGQMNQLKDKDREFSSDLRAFMGDVYMVRVICCLAIAIAYSATTVLPADVCAVEAIKIEVEVEIEVEVYERFSYW